MPDAPAPSLIAPSLARRMGAWLYECLVVVALTLAATAIFTAVDHMRPEPADSRRFLLSFLFVVLGLYCAWSWSWPRGQTLPMKTWRIRLVDSLGHPVRPGRALLRYVLCGLWFLPPLAAVAPLGLRAGEVAVIVAGWVAVWALLSRFHPQRQFWHDALAGTRLVESSPRT